MYAVQCAGSEQRGGGSAYVSSELLLVCRRAGRRQSCSYPPQTRAGAVDGSPRTLDQSAAGTELLILQPLTSAAARRHQPPAARACLLEPRAAADIHIVFME